MNQAVQSLFGKEDILKSEFDADKSSFYDLVNDTIHEVLEYQILLKACAYMDEWNIIFGVHTETKDRDKILFIKKITATSHKAVNTWKGLRDFRNQVIAHNHRNNKGVNIYLEPRRYHSPETSAEIVFLVFCLEK